MRQFCALLTFAIWAIAVIAQGAIFRWTDEQVIPGTENITPGPGVQLDRMMLEQADLRNFDLSGASFIESNLHRSVFSGSNLTNANFGGATVTNSGLRFATLNGANFREANLTLTAFGRSTLFGADFTDAVIIEGQFGSAEGFTANQLYSTASYKLKQLTATSFVGLDLSGWNFAGQDMTRMELWNTKLDGSDLSQAILYNTFLSHSSLVGANFRGADLRRAFLEVANMTGADFTDAIVSEARLRSLANRGFTAEQLYSTASYKQKHLAGIDLTQNNMRGWNFSEQDLTDAFFTHSILEGASFLNANLNSAHLAGADLTGADLTGALFGAPLSRTPTCVQQQASCRMRPRLAKQFFPTVHCVVLIPNISSCRTMTLALLLLTAST